MSEDLPALSGSRGSSRLFRDSGGPSVVCLGSVLGDGMEHARWTGRWHQTALEGTAAIQKDFSNLKEGALVETAPQHRCQILHLEDGNTMQWCGLGSSSAEKDVGPQGTSGACL